jgi:hypothetical protein
MFLLIRRVETIIAKPPQKERRTRRKRRIRKKTKKISKAWMTR